MKILYSNIVLLFITALIPSTVFADSFDEIARKILDRYCQNVFAVNAYTKQQYNESEKGDKYNSLCQNIGTAFTLDNNGYLITLNCVIKNAEEINVISNSGEEINAKVLGCDKEGSINVLEIDRLYSLSIPKATISDNINPGDKVILLSLTEGEGLTANSGIISNIKPLDGTFIVDILGNPGTSGTPLFDLEGQLLGFLAYQIEKNEQEEYKISNDRDFSHSHNYVVIPGNYAKAIAKSIINRAKSKCGWLGIYSSFKCSNSPDEKGVIIKKVIDDSPAEKYGLKVNDCVVEFNSIQILSPIHLIEAITDTKAGDTISIKVRRDGKIITSKVTLSSYHAPE